VDAQPTPDGIVINPGNFSGGTIESHGDHRIAMSFAMAALRATQPIIINDCANVNTSFPGFVELAATAGVNIRTVG
jgi:3-phosphoshikimate 1-carboxyvinyltransferase